MATVRLPRLLADSVRDGLNQEVTGSSLAEALADLFSREGALRGHLLDEQGAIRPHILIFVDAGRAELDTRLENLSEIQVIQAVSGGWESGTSLLVRRLDTNQIA
jgi:sulfur-carrier protein